MFTLQEFAKNFNGLPVPETLAKLLEFDKKAGEDNRYAEGFEFTVDEDKPMLNAYSEDPAFLNRMVEFAYGDDSGSTYCLWLREGATNLDDAPVVLFGNGGGFHLVASTPLDLIQLLLHDTQSLADWAGVSYPRGEDHEQSEGHEAFRKWALKTFNLGEKNHEVIIKEAKDKYQDAFNSWIKQYYSEED